MNYKLMNYMIVTFYLCLAKQPVCSRKTVQKVQPSFSRRKGHFIGISPFYSGFKKLGYYPGIK
jgi:hypothetical protein